MQRGKTGVNISLYLPANVGEQFQKSGVLGKSFLYLKVFWVLHLQKYDKKRQQQLCWLYFMWRITVFTPDWQLILNLKGWKLLIWQLMLGKSYCLLYSTGEQTQYFREIFTPGLNNFLFSKSWSNWDFWSWATIS